MHDTFVPLAEYLRVPVAAPEEPSAGEDDAPDVDTGPHGEDAFVEEALADIRRFRAALADALELRVERLLGDIAASVLARELRTASVDLHAIVARELALAGESPVKVRAHPDECESLAAWAGAVVADPSLCRGDVTIELRSGTIAATLGVRLDRALAAAVIA
jgi:flagellar biosynthesis/type III secretory pathway protein FliH